MSRGVIVNTQGKALPGLFAAAGTQANLGGLGGATISKRDCGRKRPGSADSGSEAYKAQEGRCQLQ